MLNFLPSFDPQNDLFWLISLLAILGLFVSYTDRPIKGGNINRMGNEVNNGNGNQGQPNNLNPGQAGHPAAEGRRGRVQRTWGQGPFNIFYFLNSTPTLL